MISFIIIGKNIQLTIEKCIASIYKAMQEAVYDNFEVIYVDSRSTDNTIALLEQFPLVKKYIITGVCNAAIARNIGGIEANGDSLFFLDGDMELQQEFLPAIYDKVFTLKYPFVSGDLLNHFYDFEGNDLNKTHPYFGKALVSDRTEYTTGGFFIISAALWKRVKGMRSYFRRGQDLDLGLRLSAIGHPLLRKKELMAIHHTISYFNKDRFLKMIKGGDYVYYGVLLRKNFFNKYTWLTFKKTQRTFLILLFLLPLSVMFSAYFALLYLGALLVRSIMKKDKQGRSFIFHCVSFMIIDCTILGSLLFFYPKDKEIKYEELL